MDRCTLCGAEPFPGASFCSKCGAPMTKNEEPVFPEVPAQSEPQPVVAEPAAPVLPEAPVAAPIAPPIPQQSSAPAAPLQIAPPQIPMYPQPGYGQPYYGPGMQYPPNPEGEKSAVTCFVLGLLSLIFFWFPIAPVVMSIISFVKFGRGKDTNKKGFSIAGLILAIIGIFLGAIYSLAYLFAFIAVIGYSM